MTRRNKERLVLAPLCLVAFALVYAGASGRFGEGFDRYSGACAVVSGMLSARLIKTFLPEREPKAEPEDSIAAVTRIAAWMVAVLVAICLVGVVGAALR